MTRRHLPTREAVHAAIDTLTHATGRPPSVLALATHLDVANTTFRRNFPDIVDRFAAPLPAHRRNRRAENAHSRIKADNDRLRAANRDLTQQLDLAINAIQRLSIDNDRLRTALHAAQTITTLPRRPGP
jgi:hypothetical protein